MGMQLYVQKISNPSQEWDPPSVESSDTVYGLKTSIAFLEGPSYDPLKIHLFFGGSELSDENTLSSYNIVKFSHITSSYESSDCNPIFDKFAYLSEDGCVRFKRLRHLGYL